MENFSAETFYFIASGFKEVQHMVEGQDRNSIIDADIGSAWFESVSGHCKSIGLRVSVRCADESIEKVKEGRCTYVEYRELLKKLNDIILLEMQDQVFMYIPSKRAERYNQQDFFGPLVTKNFPSVAFDITECGNCFAAGRFTACVFHLMRALEIGLSAFAKIFGVSSDRANWHNIIEQIESKIRETRAKNLTSDEKRKYEIYAQAANGFMFFKEAWRNYTAHARGKYTEEEADNIFRNVQSFMNKLAEEGIAE